MAKLIKSSQFFVVCANGIGDEKTHELAGAFDSDLEARKAAHKMAHNAPDYLRFYVVKSTSGFRNLGKVRKVYTF